jgi:hypothetical protein
MKVLRHQHIRVNSRLMARPYLFEHGLDNVLGFWFCKKGETVKATERNKVQSLRFLEPLKTVWHGPMVVQPPKARLLAPYSLREKEFLFG